MLLAIGGKYIFSPFFFEFYGLKGFATLQMFQLWRLIQFLKNSGRFSQDNSVKLRVIRRDKRRSL